MFTVELYARIRRAVMADGLSRRACSAAASISCAFFHAARSLMPPLFSSLNAASTDDHALVEIGAGAVFFVVIGVMLGFLNLRG